MTQKILGPEGSKRRRRFWLVPMLAAILATVFWVAGAQAVHDLTFQLDGNVLASSQTHVPSTATQALDWDSFGFNAAGDATTLPTDFTAARLDPDFTATGGTGSTFVTSDSTTFSTGSKDTLPISGWQCNFDNNVNSKIDIMNAYAAAYTDPVSGDQIVYFGLERNTNTGDANVAFWFLQADVGCTAPSGSVTFSGHHTDGDLLVVSAFTKGGDVSTINAYRWNGDDTGSLGTTPVASGVDCRSTTTPVADPTCGAANRVDIATPWLTANFKDGVDGKLRIGEFFEGGVNLTDSGLGGKCFNVFIGDTRSSASLTATLFDFARGKIGECTSTTVTTPNITAAQIPADPADASVSVTDQAAITVTGLSDWSADVSWHLCGPAATKAAALCGGTGGVAVGAAKTASDETPTVTSDAATVTAAGWYCWRADFAGDSTIGLPGSSDSRDTECFEITPRQPTLDTDATDGPVAFGGKISDTVTLANTAHKPGTGGPAGSDGSINPTTLGGDATGNITLTAYGPNSCSTVAYGPVSIAASGDGTTGGSGTTFEFTPAAPGQYVFVASYAGDSPNTLGVAATACTGQPAAEKVTVQQIPTEIKTKQSWYPNDTATISAQTGNLAAGGTVVFGLYGNATCTGTALFTETKVPVGGNTTEELSTNNTAFNITTLYTAAADSLKGAYSWKVVYTPAAGDTAHTGRQSTCDSEHFSITYTNDSGPGTLFP